MNITYAYMFSKVDGKNKEKFGGKGTNLAEMIKLGLPVPQGFILTTEAYSKYYEEYELINKDIQKQIFGSIENLEKLTGKKFGSVDNPLIVSVRSGAKVSMPGIMDTILNLGLNDLVVQGLINSTNNSLFVYKIYKSFIQTFSNVVNGIDNLKFDKIVEEFKIENNIRGDELTEKDLKELIHLFKNLYFNEMGSVFPSNVKTQLMYAIRAIFESWNNPRAIISRKVNNISDLLGTAVIVQEMIFGNIDDKSGTGVVFTRNPINGENELYGEYIINAQGEDIVSGAKTPSEILELEIQFPNLYDQLIKICNKLEMYFKEMQDIEFTVEKGKLYILQTRKGKRTSVANIKIIDDLKKQGII